MTASIDRRRSPLGAFTEAFAAASAAGGAFAIRELPFTAQVNLRGDGADRAYAEAIRGVAGCELPEGANTYTAGPRGTLLWLGPNESLFVAPGEDGDALAGAFRGALEGIRSSVTDVSAARTVIEVSGRDARLVLAKGCPLDVHRKAFAPPQCAQTVLAKARVVIQCMDAEPAYRLFVLGSFAPYLAEWLTDAAAECAAARTLDTDRITLRLA